MLSVEPDRQFRIAERVIAISTKGFQMQHESVVTELGGVLVVGHRNPDTDASASACGYAAFLNAVGRYEGKTTAVITGPLGPQSRFVFDSAGMKIPPILESLEPRVCHAATRDVRSLTTEHRIRDAQDFLIRYRMSLLPIVDDDEQIYAAFTHRSDSSRLLFGFDVIPLLSSLLDWNDLCAMPGAQVEGLPSDEPTIHGSLHVLLAGQAPPKDISREDVVVLSDIKQAHSIADGEAPRWIILIRSAEIDPADIAALNDAGSRVMRYTLSPSDFVLGLLPQIKLGKLDLGSCHCVGELDLLKDVRTLVGSSRHAIPVVDEEGKLSGVLSHTDLKRQIKRRVVLIDHFESAQAISGIQHAEILEIVDHHRIGDLETRGPVRVDCRPVGSSSTIVAEKYREAGIEPDASTATLLLGGLLSDTLCLRSPTTTDVDRLTAERLAKIASRDLETFGFEVLRAGDDLMTSDPKSIWNRDQKMFSIRNHQFAVAQLETVALTELSDETLESLSQQVVRHLDRTDCLLSAIFVTDVVRGDSWVFAAESPSAEGTMRECFGETSPREGWIEAEGIVSRKKQIIPKVMNSLSVRAFAPVEA